jgi:hypothetical protein
MQGRTQRCLSRLIKKRCRHRVVLEFTQAAAVTPVFERGNA